MSQRLQHALMPLQSEPFAAQIAMRSFWMDQLAKEEVTTQKAIEIKRLVHEINEITEKQNIFNKTASESLEKVRIRCEERK